MTRKQHIETLNRFTDPTPKGKCYTHEQLMDAVKYAIDHLSREWVSRKHHRAEIKRIHEIVNRHMENNVEYYKRAKEQKSEIDHLKADKDRMQSNLDNYKLLTERWKQQNSSLLSDWEKESEKVSEGKKIIIWLSITTAILFIILIISLFQNN